MRLICVPSLFFLITSVIIIQITHAIEFIDTNSLQQQEYQQSTSDESNIDDTSLFRGVENAIDEEAEGDDAYRIFKSLQDVTEDDESYPEEDTIEHSSSKDIKNRIQPEEEEDMEEDMEVIDDEADDDDEEDDEEEDEEEEEEEGDFSTDTFPEFKNEATSDFFEHLPQTSIEENDQIEIEEDDENDNIENHIDLHEAEEDEEEEEELLLNNQEVNSMNQQSDNNNNNNNNNINQDIINNNNIPLPLNEENTIPWQRPDSKDNLVVNVHDSKFNQDSNHNSSVYQNNNSQKSNGFRFWHGVLIVSILVIIIKSSNNRRKSHHILDTNNTWNRDEKDYLPLHSNSRGNRLYNKWEIKSS